MSFTKENWYRVGTLSANFLMLALSYKNTSKYESEIAVLKFRIDEQDRELANTR